MEVIDVRDLYKWSCAAVLWLMTSMAVSAETLTAGMSGSAVADLQNALVQAGYLARTVDGDYGSTTKEAVFLFQKDHGLPATGKQMMRPLHPSEEMRTPATAMGVESCMHLATGATSSLICS